MKIPYILISMFITMALSPSQTIEENRARASKEDKRLNDAYHMLLAAKRSDKVFIKNLRESERIWIQFRDAEMTLMFPNYLSLRKKDSLPPDQTTYLVKLTEDRTKVLLGWLETATSGLVNYQPIDLEGNNNAKEVFVSDLKLLRSGNIYNGLGIDKPAWTDNIVICGKAYQKGIVIHPETGNIVSYAEFLVPRQGGHLIGIAGWAEGSGDHTGKMRYRIIGDGVLLFGNEIQGEGCQNVNLDLGASKVLRIESDDGGDKNYGDHMAFGDLKIVY